MTEAAPRTSGRGERLFHRGAVALGVLTLAATAALNPADSPDAGAADAEIRPAITRTQPAEGLALGDRLELNYPGQDGRTNPEAAREFCLGLAQQMADEKSEIDEDDQSAMILFQRVNKLAWAQSACAVPFDEVNWFRVSYTDSLGTDEGHFSIEGYAKTPCAVLWLDDDLTTYKESCYDPFDDLIEADIVDGVGDIFDESNVPEIVGEPLRQRIEEARTAIIPDRGNNDDLVGSALMTYHAGPHDEDIFDFHAIVLGVDIVDSDIRVRHLVDLAPNPDYEYIFPEGCCDSVTPQSSLARSGQVFSYGDYLALDLAA